MLHLSQNKKAAMERLSSKNGFIEALAIDQRGAMKRMMNAYHFDATQSHIEDFKKLVSQELTPFASSILLDPEYGLPAAKLRDQDSGLLLAYEKTGYDTTEPGRFPDLLPIWSVRRLKAEGADAIKFLLYYDVDEDPEINKRKHAFVERIGDECAAEDIPFYLELVTYDANIDDAKSAAYAKVKPHKVIETMKEFSKPQYQVTVLKVEVPVNMNFVEGYGDGETVYTKDEAKAAFKEQSEATDLPYIFLSAGVSAQLFKDTLLFAKEAGSTFSGVLCGRATWKDGIKPFAEKGEQATIDWLTTQGKKNIESLNEVVEKTATPWHKKVVIDQ